MSLVQKISVDRGPRWRAWVEIVAPPLLAGWSAFLHALPPWLRGSLLGDRREVRLCVRDGTIVPILVDRSGSIDLAAQSGSASDAALRSIGQYRPVVLVVPSELVLTSDVEVPAAAAGRLDQALRYGISKWTPFSFDEVHVSARLTARDVNKARVRLNLGLRAAVDPLLRQAEAEGFLVDSLSLDGEAPLVRLRDGKYRRLRRRARIDGLLLGLAMALSAAVVIAALDRQTHERETLQSAVRASIAEHRAAQALQQETAALEALRTEILKARKSFPSIPTILSDIADALPAEAQLDEFAWLGVNGRAVVEMPQSSSATLSLPEGTTLSVDRVAMDRSSKPDQTISTWEFSIRPGSVP